MLRLLSSVANIDSQRLRTGFLEEMDFTRLAPAMNALAEAPIYIDDTPNISTMELRTKARRLQAEAGLDMIVVDYLQLMQSSAQRRATPTASRRCARSRAGSRRWRASSRSRWSPCRSCRARRRCASPRSRACRTCASRARIEQDSDLVMFLWREKERGGEDEDPEGEVINLRLAKHRNGPTGETKLYFRKRQTRFVSYRRREPLRRTPPSSSTSSREASPRGSRRGAAGERRTGRGCRPESSTQTPTWPPFGTSSSLATCSASRMAMPPGSSPAGKSAGVRSSHGQSSASPVGSPKPSHQDDLVELGLVGRRSSPSASSWVWKLLRSGCQLAEAGAVGRVGTRLGHLEQRVDVDDLLQAAGVEGEDGRSGVGDHRVVVALLGVGQAAGAQRVLQQRLDAFLVQMALAATGASARSNAFWRLS